VSGYFIGDDVKKLEHIHDSSVDADTEVDVETYDSNTIEITKIFSKNLTGLENGSYINFEETSHSTDYYKEGQKFKVSNVNKEAGTFEIKGHESPDMTKQVKWGLAKDDVTPQDIFRMTNEGPNERAIIAKYCIQDCNLVHHLMNKIDVMTGYSEMAKICSVPINFLVMRGQGIKLTSYIAKKCREKRTLMPVLEKPLFDDGYEGAIVLDPKCNLYLDNPVACVDYSSLYPSSMISENLSHDSKVWTKEYDLNRNKIRETGEKDDKGKFKYDNLPGYEYVDVEYDTFKWIPNARGKSEKTHSGTKVCRFAQFPEGRAIMPSILEELLASRKATRKLIPLQTDEFMKNILDKRQTSYKLTANSLYGQCGAKTSTFYEKDVAASCTAIGRKLLTYAKRVIEETYGDVIVETKFGKVHSNAEYVYGDSVAKYTPVYVKVDGKLQIVEMEKLAQQYGGNQWTTCIEEGKQEKEFCELYGVETWTDKGWTKLHRIIRHQLASHKKMIRILTHTGMVDVTDDHSLVLEDGNEISPKEVDIGTKLLHKTLEEYESPQFEVENNINTDMAKIYGFFFGDGSCGIYDCPSGKKASWALNNADGELLDKYINLCRTCYPEFDWQIYDTIESSGVYKITFNGGVYGNKSKFIETYREHMYSGKSKIIPDFILNGTRDIREAFWEGLYDADGDKDKNGYVRIDQKNQISAAQICWLANSIGYKTSVNTRTDKQNIYRITATKGSQRKVGNAIKKLMELDYHDYVYDLTTENHHFAAGIGNMIVHNTDSVFFTFNLKTPEGEDIRGHKALEITIELAKEAGHMASKFLKKPHDLEYEKTFMPFCLLSKKRYVGMLYENDPDKGTRKSMGIVLKRRDNAPIVKDVYGGIIDILMKEKNIQKAVEFLQTSLQNIIEEKYPMEKLIITKSLRSNYKNPQQIAHKVLADRMGKRDPGNKPSSGDRIPFVYIETKNKNCLQGEKIEHPEYILKNKIRPNYSFYITNQIMKPVQQVFALVLEDIDAFKRKKRNFQMQVDTLKNTIDDADKLSAKIDDLRHKEVKLLLFDKYLRETDNMKNKMKSITSFFA
jgi:DNA polymerase elongation subunit (family B)